MVMVDLDAPQRSASRREQVTVSGLAAADRET